MLTCSPLPGNKGLEASLTYYQQANVLINYGVTPHDADRWVRAWGLTGRPTLALKHAAPLFYEWDSALNAFERGDIDEETFLDEHGDHPDAYGDNKYHIDRPARLTVASRMIA